MLRQIPPRALKVAAQDVPLSYSQAISASLQLNLCRKHTARTQPSPVCLPQLSHGGPPPHFTSSQSLSMALGAVSALQSTELALS